MSSLLRSEETGIRQKRRDIWWRLGIAAIVLVFVLFLVLPPVVPPTGPANCPVDDQFVAQLVILLDPSDTLNPVQRRATLPRLLQILGAAPEGAEIRVYTVGDAGRGNTRPTFRICALLHPDSISSIGSLARDREIAADQYSSKFLRPLEEQLGALTNVAADTASPIIEAIQAAAVDAFEAGAPPIPRHLVIVSDMVQHSTNLSFYTTTPDFGTLARDPDYRTLRTDLDQVAVTVLQLQRRGRSGAVQIGPLTRFWEDLLLDQSVGSLTWIEVEG